MSVLVWLDLEVQDLGYKTLIRMLVRVVAGSSHGRLQGFDWGASPLSCGATELKLIVK